MRIRFYNARILTLENDITITQGEVWVNQAVIEYIGERKAETQKFEREIDVKGNLLMPGFKNAHSHSPMTFARSFADDLPLHEWLNDKIFPLERRLTGKNVYYFSKLAFMEYLTSGITATFDMYYEPDEMVAASIESGFRLVLCGAINNFKESVQLLESYYNKFNHCNELISYILGFHAEYTTDYEMMQAIGELAKSYKAPVYTHNSETRFEVNECIKKYKMTPTRLFESLGMYEYGGGGFHCTYLNDEDIEIFKKHNLYAVINTASNSKLASGIAPVTKFLKNKVKLAIGTDGPSSNNALDMFREMYLTCVIQKVKEQDASVCRAIDIIKMATLGGANVLGLDQCRYLAVGQQADIIMIDLNQPNMQPINDVVNNLVYSGSKQNVKMTMIQGKILYEDGEFLTIDKEEVFFKANEMMKALL